jgi:hypothetical protein
MKILARPTGRNPRVMKRHDRSRMIILFDYFLWRWAMECFLERHRDRVIGTLSGLDRILFRGILRSICYRDGMDRFLGAHQILYRDFGAFADGLTERIKVHALRVCQGLQRPYIYLESSTACKEEIAQKTLQEHPIAEGLICVLGCVEPCLSYQMRRNAKLKRLELASAQRKCLHLYFYYLDREFGLIHVRLQTWLPFSIQVCLNGREYLARRLAKAGIGFEQRDNCFRRIDDLPRAQRMLDDLMTRKWHRFFNLLARRVNPLLETTVGLDLRGYYWTIRQSEYATDVLFRSAQDLKAIYPALVAHALQQFTCQDVLRFLGRRVPTRFHGEVTTHLQDRAEGVRIKHRVDENSIKMYDKQGSVLRIETTINNPRAFKVYRETTRNGQVGMGWIPMRQGLADLARRADVSRAANQRYLEALSVVKQPAPTHQVLDPVSRRVVKQGRGYRGLRPITPEETELFRAILRGEHLIQGFRNKDLRRLLTDGDERNPVRRRQVSGRITRQLRLLRAHGLIRKVSKTSYYRITDKGHLVMTTALRIRELDVAQTAA